MRIEPLQDKTLEKIDKKKQKAKIVGWIIGIIILINIYVFFFSPASCSNVKKKIDNSVEKNNPEQLKKAIRGDDKDSDDQVSVNALNLKLPPSVTGSYGDEILSRENLLAKTVSGSVKRRERVIKSLGRNGLDIEEAKRVIAAFESRGLFNFRRAQPGQKFTVKMSEDGKKAFMFKYNYGRRVTLLCKRTPKGFKARKIVHPVKKTVFGIGFRISKNMATSLKVLKESYAVGQKLIALLADEIHPREFRRGDSFKILIEKKMIKKKIIGYGNILAVRVNSKRKGRYRVYYFAPQGYYTEKGISFFRQFLSRPLEGNYPPEKDNQLGGIIYPAKGEPKVWALSKGKIAFAGWAGKYGRKIEIVHKNNYRTVYYHLSSIKKGLKPGVEVSRKEIIGKAGFSGTTPDKNGVGLLSYHNGRYISQYALSSIREAPLPRDKMPEFREKVKKYDEYLAEIEIIRGGVSKRFKGFYQDKKKN
ncbi:MAG: M23 family metallopeptidase [Myxococcota bacterium]